jgi:hypothetical protein
MGEATPLIGNTFVVRPPASLPCCRGVVDGERHMGKVRYLLAEPAHGKEQDR